MFVYIPDIFKWKFNINIFDSIVNGEKLAVKPEKAQDVIRIINVAKKLRSTQNGRSGVKELFLLSMRGLLYRHLI